MENNQVDMITVNRLIQSLELIPNRICLRFQTLSGIPAVKLTLTHMNGTRETFLTPANESLIEAVLDAMKTKFETLKAFKEHGDRDIPDRSDDFELEMFKKFISSSYPMEIKEDYVSSKGNRFSQVVFTTLSQQSIYFCLKQTEEIEALLYKKKTEF